MKSRTTVFILLLLLLAIIIGAVRYVVIPKYYPELLKVDLSKSPLKQEDQVGQNTATVSALPQKYPSIATISAQMLNDLSPRQKVAQLIAVPIVVPTDDSNKSIASAAAAIQGEVPGFVTLFGQKVSALEADRLVSELKKAPIRPEIAATLQNLDEQKRFLLRPMVAVDHEGGAVQRLSGEGMTVLPPASEQCAMDRDEFVALTERAAKELHGVGIDIVFGPVVDIGSSNPILKTRLCSADANTVRAYGLGWIQALEAQHIIPVIKHYPGIGGTTVDLHQKTETIPFNAVDNGIFVGLLTTNPYIGVMTTHVALATDDGAPALPCTISADCLNHIQLKPSHLIFTDGLEMGGAQGQSASAAATTSKQSLSELSIQAIEAGHSVIVLGKTVPPSQTDQIVTDLADRYQRNPLFKQKIDQALQLIWQSKFDHWSTQL